jgi:hypothetical protein
MFEMYSSLHNLTSHMQFGPRRAPAISNSVRKRENGHKVSAWDRLEAKMRAAHLTTTVCLCQCACGRREGMMLCLKRQPKDCPGSAIANGCLNRQASHGNGSCAGSGPGKEFASTHVCHKLQRRRRARCAGRGTSALHWPKSCIV